MIQDVIEGAAPLIFSSESFQRGKGYTDGVGETSHFVVELLGRSRSLCWRRRRAVVPCVFAACENLLVVVSEIRGQSEITSLTAEERRAVSMLHKVNFSVGGLMKIQELK
jgi:hypothetical protein